MTTPWGASYRVQYVHVIFPDIVLNQALGDPKASRGASAGAWGIWRVDPGPRGVRLSNYNKLASSGGACDGMLQHLVDVFASESGRIPW